MKEWIDKQDPTNSKNHCLIFNQKFVYCSCNDSGRLEDDFYCCFDSGALEDDLHSARREDESAGCKLYGASSPRISPNKLLINRYMDR